MEKYITYIETSVGENTYSLTLESDKCIEVNSTYYYLSEAKVAKAVRYGQGNNLGPFQEKEFYNILRFPIDRTIMSQKVIKY